MTRRNTNCLADMGCPLCGNRDELRIVVSGVASVTDDGIEFVGDTEWDIGSFCQCPVCDYDGVVYDFCTGAAT